MRLWPVIPSMSFTRGLAESPLWAVYLKLVVVALCWGGTFVAGRVVAPHLPHMTVASGRYLIACALLLGLLMYQQGGLPRLTRKQLLATCAMGALGVLGYNLFFFEALERAPAGKTSLFVSLGPILTAVAVAILLKERLGWQRWTGIALALLGSVIIITDGHLLTAGNHLARAFVSGEAFMLLAVLSWVSFTIVSRFALLGMSALVATTYSTLFGTIMLLIAAATEISHWQIGMLTWENLLLVLYFGVFGTVLAFLWFSEGVKRLGPTRTIVFTNLVPVFGVILGYILLDEAIELSMVLGGIIVICGVLMTNQQSVISKPGHLTRGE